MKKRKMAKLVSHKLEGGNEDCLGLALYFKGVPTDAEVRKACTDTAGKHDLSVDVNDPGGFDWEVRPTPVSRKAGLTRVCAGPCG